jgi:hypothetical protein
MGRKIKFTIAIAVLAALATAVYAQDKYSLKSPSGIVFSDFKGYEDWSVVSSARTDEVLKVIVANPTMINAYKAGVPATASLSPRAPRSRSSSGNRRKARRPPSLWMCQRSLPRLSSWKKTARDFRKPADGDTRCSTTQPHQISSRPILAPPTAETRAIRP